MATIKKYKELSKKIRKTMLELSFKAKSAHLASCLSSADIVTVIFQSFFNKSKNKFILSKGHAAMLLYAALYHKKIISKNIKDKLSENVKIIVAKPNLSQIVELD